MKDVSYTMKKMVQFEVAQTDASGNTSRFEKVMVPVRWDPEIEEWLLTPEAHKIIEEAKSIGGLPKEIK